MCVYVCYCILIFGQYMCTNMSYMDAYRLYIIYYIYIYTLLFTYIPGFAIILIFLSQRCFWHFINSAFFRIGEWGGGGGGNYILAPDGHISLSQTAHVMWLYHSQYIFHDGVIKWKYLPRYFWPFVRAIHWSPVKSPHTSQWRGALMFSLICAWTIGSVSYRDAGDLRRHRTHYDVTVR